MRLSDLHDEIKRTEIAMAYGSETPLLGDWLARMYELVPDLPSDRGEWSEIDVPDDEARWWLEAYRRYEDCNGQCSDIQADIYDRVSV